MPHPMNGNLIKRQKYLKIQQTIHKTESIKANLGDTIIYCIFKMKHARYRKNSELRTHLSTVCPSRQCFRTTGKPLRQEQPNHADKAPICKRQDDESIPRQGLSTDAQHLSYRTMGAGGFDSDLVGRKRLVNNPRNYKRIASLD